MRWTLGFSLPVAAGLLVALGAGADPVGEPPLERVLLTAGEVGPGWDVVNEVSPDPSGDPDLVGWGVRAQAARHYTRHRDGEIQVCSLEVWAFRDQGRARAAHRGISHPGWEFSREGELLLMVHALTLPRDAAPRRGVFRACRELGERTRARARRLAREAGGGSP